MIKKAEDNELTADVSLVGMHQGNVLIQLAKRYPTLLAVLFEQVQNSLDKHATHISIMIDFSSRRIITSDNGKGTGPLEFNRALQSVGASIKVFDAMGRFGLGLIAALGKCGSFDFTSCPKGKINSFKTWTFSTKKIKRQKKEVQIPIRERNDIQFGRVQKKKKKRGKQTAKSQVWWRTQVCIKKFTKDKLLSKVNMESLTEGITERFSEAMKRLGTSIDIKIVTTTKAVKEKIGLKAKRFRGKKLPPITISDNDSGDTLFNLYLSPKTTKGYKGRIIFGELNDQYRFPLSGFVRSAEEIPDNIIKSLKSGFFEGEILSEKASLTASRKSFTKNDAFAGFCETVEKWFNTIGTDYIKQHNKQNTEKRYQDLGIQSLKNIESLLKDSYYGKSISGVLDYFREGTTGDGHHLDLRKKSKGRQDKQAKSTRGGSGKLRMKDLQKIKGKQPQKIPNKAMTGHKPFSVTGPDGKNRRIVKSDSLGIQLSHEAISGSDRLWEIDFRTGTIFFNILHPLWARCEIDDRTILRLQEFITIIALNLCDQPNELKDVQRTFCDEMMKPFVFLLTKSGSFATQAQINKLKVVGEY